MSRIAQVFDKKDHKAFVAYVTVFRCSLSADATSLS